MKESLKLGNNLKLSKYLKKKSALIYQTGVLYLFVPPFLNYSLDALLNASLIGPQETKFFVLHRRASSHSMVRLRIIMCLINFNNLSVDRPTRKCVSPLSILLTLLALFLTKL